MFGKGKAYPELGGERGMGQGWYGAIGKLAIAAFLVPYMFALNPKMIMIDGTFLEALPMIVTGLIGIWGIGGGLIGYINGPVKSYWRLLLIAGGLGLLIPGMMTDLAGTVLIFAVYFYNRLVKNKQHPAEKTAAAAKKS